MSNLVYIHGTNGSGKSTLARVVISYAGGVSGQSKLASNPRAVYTHLKTPGVVLAGKYGKDEVKRVQSMLSVSENNKGEAQVLGKHRLLNIGGVELKNPIISGRLLDFTPLAEQCHR
jgi:ABC-type branched-subunit amino acid transport system ATPase component